MIVNMIQLGKHGVVHDIMKGAFMANELNLTLDWQSFHIFSD